MTTITEFLLARIEEDEAVAKAVPPAFNQREPFSLRFISLESDHGAEDSEFVDRFNPARVLARCAADRRIVTDLCELVVYDRDRFVVSPQVESLSARTLALLALPYADHPSYDERWRP